MWSQNCDDCGPERLVLWVATVILEERTSRTPEEQDLFMQLSPIYLEKIAAAEQVGEQRGEERGEQRGRREVVLLLLTQKFDPLPTDLKTRIEALNVEQFQSLTTSLFQFDSITDLSDWLDHL
jgi:predicted transposase YdaD